MRKTTKQTFKLGLLVVTGLIIFIVAIYFIGAKKSMFDQTYTISTHFKNVDGLMLGNNVRYAGINVGTVKSINMVNDTTIKVDFMINKKVVPYMKKDALATIGSDGLVGNMIVNILPGEGDAAPIRDGDVIQSFAPVGTNEMLKTLSKTNDNAAVLSAKLLDIVNAISDGKGTVGRLINDSIVYTDIQETISNLKRTSVETHRTVNELNNILNEIDMHKGVAGVLLNNETEANKLRQTLTNLENSSSEIQSVVGNLNSTITNLDQAVTNIKEGEGVINYLSNDPEMVKELDQSIKNINEGTAKFNESMEALKHNFLLRGYFRRLERQEKKAAENLE